MKKKITVAIFVSIFILFIYADSPEVVLEIVLSGTPTSSILNNDVPTGFLPYGIWFHHVKEFFTNEWYEIPPDITPSLAAGYTWHATSATGEIFAMPTFHYELRAKDQQNILSPTDFIIKRVAVDIARHVYDENGDIIEYDSSQNQVSYFKNHFFQDDTSYPFFTGIQGDYFADLDMPSVNPEMFLFPISAERVVYRVNFYAWVHSNTLGDLYEETGRNFKLQIENLLRPSDDYVQHGSTFIIPDDSWSESELQVPVE